VLFLLYGDLQVTFLKRNFIKVTFWNFIGLQRIFIDFYPIAGLILRNVMHIFIKTFPTNIILQSIFIFKMRKVT